MWILIIALIELGRIWTVVRMVQYTLFFGNTGYWTIALIISADWFCMSVLSRVLNVFWPYYPSTYLRRNSWLGNWLRKRIQFKHVFLQGADVLDPLEKYIFASHSHGILSTAQLLTFMLYNDEFPWKSIPDNTISTVGSELLIFPLTNLICRLLGALSISTQSLETILLTGKNVSIVPGGAKEMSLCIRNNKDTLYILQREGFLKLAYKHKRPVVPMITMDNHTMYKIYPGPSWLEKFTLKHLNYGFPIFALGTWGTIVPLQSAHVLNVVLPAFWAKEEETVEHYIERYYQGLRDAVKGFGITLNLVKPQELEIQLSIEQILRGKTH
jgi:hypothetical protein